MKNFANKLLPLLAVALPLATACASDFNVKLLNDPTAIKVLRDALLARNKAYTLVSDQVLQVEEARNQFIMAPFISTDAAKGGCYIHAATMGYKLTKAYLIARNEDAVTCDAVVAVFSCRLQMHNGVGVIYGMRLGAGNYYTEGSLFEIRQDGDLTENLKLSQKIHTDDSAATAKKKIGCLK
jgi:hypothetical protein